MHTPSHMDITSQITVFNTRLDLNQILNEPLTMNY